MVKISQPIAFISDIHANLEALTAVIADIRSQNIESIICLGDIVGYGPDPEACIDLVEAACSVVLCGNHDYAVLFEADGFNPIARKAIDYHRRLLRPDMPEDDENRLRRWEWLRNLEPMYEGFGFEAMHGSPRQPISEYVLPSDPELDAFKVNDLFLAMSNMVAFIGHTHYPGIIEEGAENFLVPSMFDNVYEVKGTRLIVNVGSVGQPRDRDIRSCYAIFDGEKITYRRVDYDVEKTIQKVLSIDELHPACGLRLREGR